jgi:hypothetical protein
MIMSSTRNLDALRPTTDHLRFRFSSDLNIVPSTSTEVETSDLLIHVGKSYLKVHRPRLLYRQTIHYSIETEPTLSTPPTQKVLFKFKPDHTDKVQQFQTEIQSLSHLSCVTSKRLVCQGPVPVPVPPSSSVSSASSVSASETDDDALRQGYHLCLISHHPGLPGLAAYQHSAEHHDVTTRLMFPFKEGES